MDTPKDFLIEAQYQLECAERAETDRMRDSRYLRAAAYATVGQLVATVSAENRARPEIRRTAEGVGYIVTDQAKSHGGKP